MSSNESLKELKSRMLENWYVEETKSEEKLTTCGYPLIIVSNTYQVQKPTQEYFRWAVAVA
jgi:hypothetical protein